MRKHDIGEIEHHGLKSAAWAQQMLDEAARTLQCVECGVCPSGGAVLVLWTADEAKEIGLPNPVNQACICSICAECETTLTRPNLVQSFKRSYQAMRASLH